MSAAIHSLLVHVHATILVSAAGAAWLYLRRQSAARRLAGARAIMGGVLVLAAAESALRIADGSGHGGSPGIHTLEEPALPSVDSPQEVRTAVPTASGENAPVGEPQIRSLPAAAGAGPGWWRTTPEIADGLMTVWATGAFMLGILWLRDLRARRRMEQEADPVTDAGWQAMLREVTNGATVRLMRHPGDISPCAWQNTIVVPAAADYWSGRHRRMVLLHEYAHLRQRDPLWNLLGRVFLMLQWYNPIAWLLVNRYQAMAEQAVDDSVLATTGDGPAYAELLVHCARAGLGPPAALCAMARRSTTGVRVERILDESCDRRPAAPWSRVRWAAAIILGGCAAFLTIPSPVAAEDEPPLPDPAGPVPATESTAEMQNRLQSLAEATVQWDGITLLDALNDLKKRWQVNFILRSSTDKKITLALRNIPARELLETMATVTGTQIEAQENAIVFKDADAPAAMETSAYELSAAQAALFDGDQSAKDVLTKAGIRFSEGAAAGREPGSRRLTVKNTPEELARVAAWVVDGKPNAPFEWKPVQINSRDYVAATAVARFYGFHTSVREKPEESGGWLFRTRTLEMHWQRDLREIRINNIRFGLEQPVVENGGTLWISRADLGRVIEPVVRTPRIPEAGPLTTVVIDAGHGGEDTGAQGLKGLNESVCTLDTALHLKRALEAGGWTVVMTRDKQVFIPRTERVTTANAHPGAVLISVHYDAMPNAAGIQTEPLTPYPANPELTKAAAEKMRQQSTALASAVHARCVRRLDMADGGVNASRTGVLAGVKIPAILANGGNLLDAGDAGRIADEEYRKKFAGAIAEGLSAYRKAVGREPQEPR